jgi:hypothetical protein
MLNGTLAQNPFFIFWMAVLVNGFFGLFSIYGMDFRYSLFLLVYTWNGVVLCQYSGTCCQSGTVLTFGGKAASTCLGAVWAMIFSILIKPVYTSEVILGLEKDFLAQVMEHMKHSWASIQHLMNADLETRERVESQTRELRERLVLDIDTITRLRISSFKACAKEIMLNSLDERELQFIKLNLIPLPSSVRLASIDASLLGSIVSASCKSLYLATSGLAKNSTMMSALFEAVSPDTSILLEESEILSKSIQRFLQEQRKNDLAARLDDVQLAVSSVQSARKNLSLTYADQARAKILGSDISYGELKLLAYYSFLLRALLRIEELGVKILTDEKYLERDGFSSFFTSWYTRRVRGD